MHGHRILLVSILLTLAFVFHLAGTAVAATYHVSPFGSNTAPYDTYAKAATDPRNALETASGYGDTVLIHAGDYDVDTAIVLPNGLVIHGVSRDSSRLVWVGPYLPETRHIFDISGDHDIADLEFANPAGPAMEVTGLFGLNVATGTVRVTSCNFIQTGILGTTADTFLVHDCLFVTMHGSAIHTSNYPGQKQIRIWNNTFLSSAYASPDGIYNGSYTPDSIIVENNIFDFSASYEGRSGYAIVCDEGGRPMIVRNNLFYMGELAVLWLYTEGVFENNTIDNVGRTTGGIPPYINPWSITAELDRGQTLRIRNNVFSRAFAPPRFTVCASCGPGARIEYWHNMFWPPADSFYLTEPPAGYLTVVDSANFNAYPMFADDSLYRLQTGSPLIDCGDPLVLDADGSRSDIGWTGGPGGTTYSCPQMAPLPPESLWVEGVEGVVRVTWSSRPEADLVGYRLYRGVTTGFWIPGLTPHRVLVPADTSALDTTSGSGVCYYYVVTALDTAGLESGPSPEGSYVSTGVVDDPTAVPLPRTPYIARVYPNPFNAATTMEVYIPDIGALPAPVEVRLYDVEGHFITAAFRGRLGAGRSTVSISAVDSTGKMLSSGVYFARLRVWASEFGPARKLVLVK